MPEYPLSGQTDLVERRLALIEERFDAGTRARLDHLEVAAGWQCLEVGAGRGSIARWLSMRVGREGLVRAVDVDAGLLSDLPRSNVEVRELDALLEAPPDGGFDLIHTRAFLMHLEWRETLLDRFVDVLSPGGWLLLEEVDGFPAQASTSETFARTVATMTGSWTWARCLPIVLRERGLENVDAEIDIELVNGASPNGAFWRASLEQLGERMIADGLSDEEDLRETLRLLADPDFWTPMTALICAWGRKPGG